MKKPSAKSKKLPIKWYYGGISGTLAVSATHPLDLAKVHLQTSKAQSKRFISVFVKVIKNDGVLGLYNGLSASILRQITYSFPRFGLHDWYKNTVSKKRKVSVVENVMAAGFGGAIGGITGNPADMINVRMQNDMKLPEASRRNYKSAFHGLFQVFKNEGFKGLFSGVTMTTNRAILMTIGQGAGYDQMKLILLSTNLFDDNPATHILSAFGAAGIATFLTQPFDVMKTRLMNAQVGQYTGLGHCAKDILLNGPLGFFKGIVPAFVRIGPHTILLFIIKEQLIKYF
uniref:Slc25a-19 n=1 Tax=Schmidtea mediterranea TaxID=79327 RepID=A0A0H3YFF2_SCHMD|nr:slc25a-19 [Schmidtea mediterranea]